jgi:hypothetical protein
MSGTFVELKLAVSGSAATTPTKGTLYHITGKRSQEQMTIQVLCEVYAAPTGKQLPTFREITARLSSG